MNCKIIELPGIKTEDVNYNRIVLLIQLADVADMDKNNDLFMLLSCLITGGLKKIIFDMAEVEFIDSYGMGTLIDITKMIRKHKDGDAVLINVPERIQLIFKPIQLQKFMKIFTTLDEALHYFRYV
ncbi:MAG: STAS domain-containing protein [Spirochaetes bacterium]|nr:STAS domain-containing protein [Spirochaetota bacterium]